jgi:hypothetical protein
VGAVRHDLIFLVTLSAEEDHVAREGRGDGKGL